MPGGRPTKYDPDIHIKQVYELALLGATDVQIAKVLGIAESTLNKWKLEHPQFSESLNDGKDKADAEIAQALFHRAKGYSHAEDKIFNNNGEPLVVPTTKHYPPDPTAIIFWLKNRQSGSWRDKQEHTHDVEGNLAEILKAAQARAQ